MRKKYPSDITREQFDVIRHTLESARKKTRPREVDLYDVFCGVLYVLKSGCQWRMIPSDFPKWRTCYAYFQIWSAEKRIGRKKQPSLLEEVLKKNKWRGSFVQWSERDDKHGHR
jgi:transposase